MDVPVTHEHRRTVLLPKYLFNDSVKSSRYLLSDGRMIQSIIKWDGSGCGLLRFIIPEFTWT